MTIESYLPADQVPSCVDHGPYAEMSMEVLASLAVAGDDAAYAEVSRRVATGARAVSYDYELRHPGHADQSVHNPHKGGPRAYKPGAWRPVTKDELAKMDERVENDIADWNPRNQMVAIDRYRRERISGDTYTNGSVVVRFPAKGKNTLTKEEQRVVLDDIDAAGKFAPEGMFNDPSFPIEINVGGRMSGRRDGEWSGSPQRGGRLSLRASSQKDRTSTVDDMDNGAVYSKNVGAYGKESVYPKSVPYHPEATKSQLWASSIVAHEIGHAAQDYGIRAGKGDGLSSTAFGFISGYAAKNSQERYAEHFAAWAAGATDSVTAGVASKHGWRKP